MNILPGRESFFHVSCLGSYRASLGGPDEGDCEPTFPTPSSGNSKNFSHKHFTHTSKNVSFHVYEGELLAIMGTNGSGKNTLLHILLQNSESG